MKKKTTKNGTQAQQRQDNLQNDAVADRKEKEVGEGIVVQAENVKSVFSFGVRGKKPEMKTEKPNDVEPHKAEAENLVGADLPKNGPNDQPILPPADCATPCTKPDKPVTERSKRFKVADEKISSVRSIVDEDLEIIRNHEQDRKKADLAIGDYLLKRYFKGSVRQYRSGKRTEEAAWFKALLNHPDLPCGARMLRYKVELAGIRREPDGKWVDEIPISRCIAILAAPEKKQAEIAARVLDEKLTDKEMKDLIRQARLDAGLSKPEPSTEAGARDGLEETALAWVRTMDQLLKEAENDAIPDWLLGECRDKLAAVIKVRKTSSLHNRRIGRAA
ncbi:MAG: hypothetical protein C4523_01995 [Myxococcales bacterium]|nr:MAG: hypothetical protein C4523_01995 [Myxococcales bacterium]